MLLLLLQVACVFKHTRGPESLHLFEPGESVVLVRGMGPHCAVISRSQSPRRHTLVTFDKGGPKRVELPRFCSRPVWHIDGRKHDVLCSDREGILWTTGGSVPDHRLLRQGPSGLGVGAQVSAFGTVVYDADALFHPGETQPFFEFPAGTGRTAIHQIAPGTFAMGLKSESEWFVPHLYSPAGLTRLPIEDHSFSFAWPGHVLAMNQRDGVVFDLDNQKTTTTTGLDGRMMLYYLWVNGSVYALRGSGSGPSEIVRLAPGDDFEVLEASPEFAGLAATPNGLCVHAVAAQGNTVIHRMDQLPVR